MDEDEGRPSTSGSVLFYPHHPQTHIYPPRKDASSSLDRPSSSGTIIIHPDEPATIIYPKRHLFRSPSSTDDPSSTVADSNRDEKAKRKRGDSPPPAEATQPRSKIFGLVVLLQQGSLQMATDFAAFKSHFDAHHITAEYRSLVDLEDIIAKEGDLIYGRDDIEGRTRETVLTKDHDKFYTVEKDPKKLKDGILQWLRGIVPRAQAEDNIMLILISHGTKSGSVVVGGETAKDPVTYLTNVEVRAAIANLKWHSYFTLINTCCYSGGWINLAGTGMGKRFVHAAAGAKETAPNFVTGSGNYRGGVFVTALLECLKKSGDGTLREFVAEIKAEAAGYRHPAEPDAILGTPTASVSRSVLWNRPINAFIPVQKDSCLAETVTCALKDLKSVSLDQLFKHTRPAIDRESVPDERVRQVLEAKSFAMKRGGANGEDQIYKACNNLLDGDANQTMQQALFRTVSWRESAMLQASRLAHHLQAEDIIRSDLREDYDDEALSANGDIYYRSAFSGNKLIDGSKLPPEGCIGGLWENPFTWLSNVVASSKSPISVTRVRDSVELFLAEDLIAKSERKKR
jgi:hypothetical protein